MLPSVKDRKKNKHVFNLCYNDMCKVKNLVPLGNVKAHLLKNSLDFIGDRVKLAEWFPILHALALDRSLIFVAVRSLQKHTIQESLDTAQKGATGSKIPVLFTRYVMMTLMTSLKECLSATKVLVCIELEGLPLTQPYLEQLCKGIAACDSLQNISLHRSHIGDAGVEMVCRTVKYLTRVVSMDLSACGVGAAGIVAVAEMIRYQKMLMYSDFWQQTLRDREAETDPSTFPGLRRITLNHNPKIGDSGALLLVEAISDNMWLKAVDMQDCGLTDSSSGVILSMLKADSSLAILDVRCNRISPGVLKKIMLQLSRNNANQPHSYHWLSVDHRILPAKHVHRIKPPQMKPQFRPRSSQPHYAQPLEGLRIRPDTAGSWLMEVNKMEAPPYQNMVSSASSSPSPPLVTPTPPQSADTVVRSDSHIELVRKLSIQLEQAEQANKSLTMLVKEEMQKRLQAEAQAQKMQSQLQEKVVLHHDTVEDIQSTFTSFAAFLKKIRESGFGSPCEGSSSPDVLMTDEELKERMKLVLSRSSHERGQFQRQHERRPRRSQSVSQVSDWPLVSARAETGATGDSQTVKVRRRRQRRHTPPSIESPAPGDSAREPSAGNYSMIMDTDSESLGDSF